MPGYSEREPSDPDQPSAAEVGERLQEELDDAEERAPERSEAEEATERRLPEPVDDA